MEEMRRPKIGAKVCKACMETGCRYHSDELANGCCRYTDTGQCLGVSENPLPPTDAAEVKRRKMGWRQWERERRKEQGPWANAIVRMEELAKAFSMVELQLSELANEISEARRAEMRTEGTNHE